jgi:hypothetical protein
MKITEKDIGRKARLRDGNTTTITAFDPKSAYPVIAKGRSYTICGHFIDETIDEQNDIVELLEEAGEIPQSETGSNVKLNDEDWPSPCSEDEELLGSTKSFEEDIEEWSNSCVGEEDDEELDERFVTKVPSIESNTIRLLKQLKRQGITELTIVADLGDGKRGEIRMEIYNYGKS